MWPRSSQALTSCCRVSSSDRRLCQRCYTSWEPMGSSWEPEPERGPTFLSSEERSFPAVLTVILGLRRPEREGEPSSWRGANSVSQQLALKPQQKITPSFCLDLSLITPVYPVGVATCLWLLRHLPGLTDGSLCRGGRWWWGVSLLASCSESPVRKGLTHRSSGVTAAATHQCSGCLR